MEVPIIAPSACRHGVNYDVILHVFNNPILVEELDDRLIMLVGPDRVANLYEIGVVDSEEGPVIVHAMLARPKYLR